MYPIPQKAFVAYLYKWFHQNVCNGFEKNKLDLSSLFLLKSKFHLRYNLFSQKKYLGSIKNSIFRTGLSTPVVPYATYAGTEMITILVF